MKLFKLPKSVQKIKFKFEIKNNNNRKPTVKKEPFDEIKQIDVDALLLIIDRTIFIELLDTKTGAPCQDVFVRFPQEIQVTHKMMEEKVRIGTSKKLAFVDLTEENLVIFYFKDHNERGINKEFSHGICTENNYHTYVTILEKLIIIVNLS